MQHAMYTILKIAHRHLNVLVYASRCAQIQTCIKSQLINLPAAFAWHGQKHQEMACTRSL